MSWSARRRFVILLIIGAVILAFLATVSIATFYKAPSCTDNKQNQDESGIDCGGSCRYLCLADQQPPTILFTKAIPNGEGRVDVIAEVENRNVGVAAKNVPYSITLYNEGQFLIQKVTGTIDLPPSGRVPIFVPGIPSGKRTVANAFLEIAPSSLQWFNMSSDPRNIPVVSNTIQSGTVSSPRIEATLVNASVAPLNNVRLIVLVRSDKGDVIAASATLVPVIPGQGRATATFTWNSAFTEVPASIEVVPIVPLP